MLPVVKKFYEVWCSQADNAGRNRLLAKALGQRVAAGEQAPAYCDDPNESERAINLAWGNVEEESVPRYNCQISETADQSRRRCVVEWWPDDDTHIMTPRFETESEAKAFAAYVFSLLKSK